MKIGFALTGTLVLVTSLFAATPQGDFVLVEEGLAGGRNFATLATLSLDGAGNIAGSEVVRSAALSVAADVKGTYIMSSANSGTIALSVVDSTESDAAPVIQTYRFLVTKNGDLQAIRIDAGVLSVSTLSPYKAAPNSGTLALNELDRSAALLAQMTLDGNGALAGSAREFTAGGESAPAVTGAYTAPAKGLGSLTLRLISKDDDGNDVTETRTYRTAATAEGVHVIRLDPGEVSLATLEAL